MLDFNCLEKGLGIVSQPRFVYVSRKMFPMLYPVNWLYSIISLPLCLEIMDKKYVYRNCLLPRLGNHKI